MMRFKNDRQRKAVMAKLKGAKLYSSIEIPPVKVYIKQIPRPKWQRERSNSPKDSKSWKVIVKQGHFVREGSAYYIYKGDAVKEAKYQTKQQKKETKLNKFIIK